MKFSASKEIEKDSKSVQRYFLNASGRKKEEY